MPVKTYIMAFDPEGNMLSKTYIDTFDPEGKMMGKTYIITLDSEGIMVSKTHINAHEPVGKMESKAFIDAFDPEEKSEDICQYCGLCLQQCPVMKMQKAESQAEIRRLIKGQVTQRVLDECTFCSSCNYYCPHGLRPFVLIMERALETISSMS